MKKFLFIATLMAAANFSFAQKIQKGNLLGLHVMTVTLNPNVKMDQFAAFYNSKVIPSYEKAFQGAKGFILKGRRGEHNDRLCILWHFETEQARDQFFNPDGSNTDAGKRAVEKLNDIGKELEKLGSVTTVYTDWIVQ